MFVVCLTLLVAIVAKLQVNAYKATHGLHQLGDTSAQSCMS
ncbi:Uncharacterised protein [Mycobacteroides abscessus subsp. massiliense]|nr:Uncharacterised protein [Mycobacteroides abscessus subsp. massiliense]SKU07680.1 Uncharacterised protein [Mycobacteroides abscessus subsp. massiliense]